MLLRLRLRGVEKDARLVAVLAALAWVRETSYIHIRVSYIPWGKPRTKSYFYLCAARVFSMLVVVVYTPNKILHLNKKGTVEDGQCSRLTGPGTMLRRGVKVVATPPPPKKRQLI